MTHHRHDAPKDRSWTPPGMDRRAFLKCMGLLGGGLVVSVAIGDPTAWARKARSGFLGANVPVDFNAFLKIGTDGKVTCLTGKIEMGQGVITSLPQLLADELDVAYENVDIIMGDTDLCPWDAGTFGSLSIRVFGVYLREAASEAKGVLKEMAAETLQCPVDRLETENGTIFDRDHPGKKVTYGQLTKGKVIERRLEEVPPLKTPDEYKVMGQSFPRRDSLDKVTGRAEYAADIRPEGLVYARILRPPAHGARLIEADLSAAEKMEGVTVVQDGDFIAVLHRFPDMAGKALAAIKAEFSTVKTGLDDKNIFDHVVKHAPRAAVADQQGDVQAGEAKADFIIEETYLDGYVAHAPIEPHAATAMMQDGRMVVWASTQGPFGVQRSVAEALNLPPDKVRVVTPYVGGGFGGKNPSNQAVEAARLAKITGRPVQVAWTRAEEFFYDAYRPASVVKIKSGVNRDGKMVFWDYHTYCAGERGAEQFYDIPDYRVSTYGGWYGNSNDHPFAIGAWRAPGASTNTFAREVQLNLMAAKAGMDPLDFRLSNLKNKRMLNVWKAAAEKFGWTPAQPPSGRGYGLASGIDADTYVAFMVEIELNRETGHVDVRRMVCAQDMGFVVNPEGARMQMEGCLTMSLGYALTEDVHFSDGRLFDLNFDTYLLPTFAMLPKIETVLVDNRDHPSTGGGEPAVIGAGGAIATAIHDITGVMPRQLPMTPARVKAAMNRQG